MHGPTQLPHAILSASLDAMKLEDFGKLQARYQSLPLAGRAGAVLADAEVALETAENILAQLGARKEAGQIFESLRKNYALTGKMRPSEAKNMLMDSGNDFIETVRHKLAAWRKTMQRLAGGEGIVNHENKEYISSHVPVAMAIASVATISNYLSIVQLAIGELAKLDAARAGEYSLDAAKIRRCATLLSDCENAASFTAVVH